VKDHKAEFLGYYKEYKESHKVEIAASLKKYRRSHKAEILACSKKYYYNHRREVLAHLKKYQEERRNKNQILIIFGVACAINPMSQRFVYILLGLFLGIAIAIGLRSFFFGNSLVKPGF
jgi:hypothetical protein